MTVTALNTKKQVFNGKFDTFFIVFLLLSALINSNLHLGRTHVHLKWGPCHDDRYNRSRQLTILLQQPVNVINDEAPWGCRMMVSAAASWHWLIEGETKTQGRDRVWHRRDDKNIITTAAASQLFATNYAQQLWTALVSHLQIALLPASQGHKEKAFIEKRFMSMWLMQEPNFRLWLMIITKLWHALKHVWRLLVQGFQ